MPRGTTGLGLGVIDSECSRVMSWVCRTKVPIEHEDESAGGNLARISSPSARDIRFCETKKSILDRV